MKRLFWPLNLLVLAALAWAIGHFWGWHRLFAPWAQVPAWVVAGVVATQMSSYALRATRIWWADARIPRHAWGQCLRLILINNALNLLLPARTGEASFPLLLQRYFGVPLAEGAGTLLWLRLLDLNILLCLASLTLLPVLLPWAAPWAWAIAMTSAALPLLAPWQVGWLRRMLGSPTTGWRGKAQQVLDGIPRRVTAVLRDQALTWSAWLIKLIGLTAAYAFLANLHPATALMGVIGGDLSTILPIHTPGGFGTYEAGVIAFASPLAGPSPALLAAAVNLHLLLLGIALGAGALAWLVRKSHPKP